MYSFVLFIYKKLKIITIIERDNLTIYTSVFSQQCSIGEEKGVKEGNFLKSSRGGDRIRTLDFPFSRFVLSPLSYTIIGTRTLIAPKKTRLFQMYQWKGGTFSECLNVKSRHSLRWGEEVRGELD